MKMSLRNPRIDEFHYKTGAVFVEYEQWSLDNEQNVEF